MLRHSMPECQKQEMEKKASAISCSLYWLTVKFNGLEYQDIHYVFRKHWVSIGSERVD